jgi:hypothetical protein
VTDEERQLRGSPIFKSLSHEIDSTRRPRWVCRFIGGQIRGRSKRKVVRQALVYAVTLTLSPPRRP